MKLKIGCIDEPLNKAASAVVNPNADAFALWSLDKPPIENGLDGYTISDVTTKELSNTVDILVLAGMRALQIIKCDTDLWEINYYE